MVGPSRKEESGRGSRRRGRGRGGGRGGGRRRRRRWRTRKTKLTPMGFRLRAVMGPPLFYS
eukprot:1797717-Pyramimonas_sp.AAC.1